MHVQGICRVVATVCLVGVSSCTPPVESNVESQLGEATEVASSLEGLATVSGAVTSPESFRVGRVSLHHTEKNIRYMVYAVGGEYRAMHLFPGTYDLSVEAGELVSDVTRVTLDAGVNEHDLSLRPAEATDETAVTRVTFDELYPPGPERSLARTCLSCHGVGFLPERQWSAERWDLAVQTMALEGRVDFSKQEHEMLVGYLADNFGPESAPRELIDSELPVDEEALGKAMFVEYYLPPHPEDWEDTGVRRGQDPHFDQEGYVWVTDRGTPYSFLKLDPRTGEWMGQWKNPGVGFSHGLTIDSEGVVWLQESDGGNHLNAFDTKTEAFVGRYHYNPNGELDDYTIRPTRSHTPILDSAENVWVSMIHGDRLIKWDRETRQTTLYEPITSPSQPYGIDVDADDNVWVVLSEGPPRIGKFDTRAEEWTEYAAPTTTGRIRRLSVDRNGIVWYGHHTAGTIGRLDPATGEITEIPVPLEYGSVPYDIQPDSANHMWFGDSGQRSAIVKYDQVSGDFTFYPAPQVTDFPKIEITREDAIWYCPRSAEMPGVGVLYPDMTKVSTLGAYYDGLTWRTRDET